MFWIHISTSLDKSFMVPIGKQFEICPEPTNLDLDVEKSNVDF